MPHRGSPVRKGGEDVTGDPGAMTTRALSYPLHPRPDQAATMARWFDGCRWLWNQAVEHANAREREWRRRRHCWNAKSLQAEPAHALTAAIPAARQVEGGMLDGVPGTWAQGTLKQLGDGWALHFSKLKAGRPTKPPTFRNRHRSQSVRFAVQEKSRPATPGFLVRPTTSARFSEVKIVKVGWVRARIDRPLPPEALCGSMVVRRDQTGRWWVTFQCKIPAPERQPTGQVVGVNRGVALSLVTDDGRTYSAPGLTAGERRRKLKLEKGLARKRRQNPCPADSWIGGRLHRGRCECAAGTCWKASKRYNAERLALLKLRNREARRRHDAAHKVSAVLAGDADVVVFEGYEIERMTATAAGTTDAPGDQVAAKRDLNRGQLAQTWGAVHQMTAYKTETVTVSPVYISSTCPACGHVDDRNHKGRSFRCRSCGHSGHVDRVAALNVRARGIADLSGDNGGTAATQAVAGRGGQGRRAPDEPSTCPLPPVRTAGDSTQGISDTPIVPEHWGILTTTSSHHD